MLIKDLLLEMPPEDLPRLEDAVDNMFRTLGLDIVFTNHFKERAVETGTKQKARDEDVTAKEIFQAFNKLKNNYGQQLYDARHDAKVFHALLKDIASAINMPFVIDYDKVYNGLHKLKVVTLMRKSGFKSDNFGDQKILTVK